MLSYISQGGLLGDVGPNYSYGLREAGRKLEKAYPGKVVCTHFDHTQDDELYDAIVDAMGKNNTIMLTGHSLGANGILNMLPVFRNMGRRIDTVITFDPTWNVWSSQIGNEVGRCINFYNTSWFSALGKRKVYATSGFTGHLANMPLNVLHQNVDDDLGAHAIILREGGWLVNPKTGSSTLPEAAIGPKEPVKPPSQQIPVSNYNGRDLRDEFPPTTNIS